MHCAGESWSPVPPRAVGQKPGVSLLWGPSVQPSIGWRPGREPLLCLLCSLCFLFYGGTYRNAGNFKKKAKVATVWRGKPGKWFLFELKTKISIISSVSCLCLLWEQEDQTIKLLIAVFKWILLIWVEINWDIVDIYLLHYLIYLVFYLYLIIYYKYVNKYFGYK